MRYNNSIEVDVKCVKEVDKIINEVVASFQIDDIKLSNRLVQESKRGLERHFKKENIKRKTLMKRWRK